MKKNMKRKGQTKAQLAKAQRRARFKAWAALSLKLRERAGECQACGSTERLQAHHVLHRKQNPALLLEENDVAVLCARCHCRLHRGREVEFWMWFEEKFPEKAAWLRRWLKENGRFVEEAK